MVKKSEKNKKGPLITGGFLFDLKKQEDARAMPDASRNKTMERSLRCHEQESDTMGIITFTAKYVNDRREKIFLISILTISIYKHII